MDVGRGRACAMLSQQSCLLSIKIFNYLLWTELLLKEGM